MRKLLNKIIAILGIVMLISLVGCAKEEPTEGISSKDVVLKVGSENITYSEVWIYANTIKEGYESSYGNGIWNLSVDNSEDATLTIGDITRRDVIETIIRTKVLVTKASEYDVALSGEEKEIVNQQSKEFFEHLTDENIQECGASVELAMKVFEENAIADKVYSKILKGNTYEVSEEEARMTTIFDMVFETYNIDEDGSPIPYTEEEKQIRLDEANDAFAKLVTSENVVIEDIVNEYNLKYATNHTLSYDEMLTEYGEKACSVIYSLSDGACSSVIATDYGYHIVKMIASTDTEATTANRDKINKENEKKYFNEVYAGWRKSAVGNFDYDKDVNKEVYDRITF